MYSVKIKPEQVKSLYLLREYAAKGPIARQIKNAIDLYLANQTNNIGAPIEDIAETMQRYDAEKDRKNYY